MLVVNWFTWLCSRYRFSYVNSISRPQSIAKDLAGFGVGWLDRSLAWLLHLDDGTANLCYVYMLISVIYIMSGVFQVYMETNGSAKLFCMFSSPSICVFRYFSCYVAMKLGLPLLQDMPSCLLGENEEECACEVCICWLMCILHAVAAVNSTAVVSSC